MFFRFLCVWARVLFPMSPWATCNANRTPIVSVFVSDGSIYLSKEMEERTIETYGFKLPLERYTRARLAPLCLLPPRPRPRQCCPAAITRLLRPALTRGQVRCNADSGNVRPVPCGRSRRRFPPKFRRKPFPQRSFVRRAERGAFRTRLGESRGFLHNIL